MTHQELLHAAENARKHAYCPYSGFSVGAALLCDDGTVYTGTNIENASFSPTVCAERVAFFKAVSDGKHHFSAIAIVGGKDNASAPCPPCGVCRQVMAEFCSPEFTIVLKNANGDCCEYSLAQLLPYNFSL